MIEQNFEINKYGGCTNELRQQLNVYIPNNVSHYEMLTHQRLNPVLPLDLWPKSVKYLPTARFQQDKTRGDTMVKKHIACLLLI